MKYINNNSKFDLVDERNREKLEQMVKNEDSVPLFVSLYGSREHIYRNRYSFQKFEEEPPIPNIVFLNDDEFTFTEEFKNFYLSTNKNYKKSMKDTLNHALGIFLI